MRDWILHHQTSGRPPQGMRMLIEPLGLTLPMAAFNGGMSVFPDMTVLDECPLPDDVLPAVVDTILYLFDLRTFVLSHHRGTEDTEKNQ